MALQFSTLCTYKARTTRCMQGVTSSLQKGSHYSSRFRDGAMVPPPMSHINPSSFSQASARMHLVATRAHIDDDELEAQNMSFFERLVKAWRILFPSKARRMSDADLARERLRLVLYSDRGELAADVRQGLRQRIIEAIGAYVEIESEEDVQLNVTADPDLGTVYAITIPVRRVRPEFQGYWSEVGFRDRFYEELLRSQGITERFSRIELRRDFERERQEAEGAPQE